MTLTLFHGSDHVIETPKYGEGNIHNDYGRGFYCTENEELAKEWACSERKDGYANEYELDTGKLSILDLNSDEYNILNWLAILAENRTYWQKGSIAEEAKRYIRTNFLVDLSCYDIIRGYRADDSYFSFAQDFVSGAISLETLSKAMRLGKLGEQIVLKSEKAFDTIRYVGSTPAASSEYYARRSERDSKARKEYRESRKQSDLKNELYIIDIMREEIKNGDPRIR